MGRLGSVLQSRMLEITYLDASMWILGKELLTLKQNGIERFRGIFVDFWK